jgi:NTE family protein
MIQLRADASVELDRVTSAARTGSLSLRDQAEIWSRARVRHLMRGETLLVQNTPADAFFLVVSGRFEIRTEGQPVPLAEIGAGEPIGEIAFFSGGLRTPTAITVRTQCPEIDRASFEEVARRVPGIYNCCWQARPKACDPTARLISSTRVAAARTVTVIPAGHGGVPPEFFRRFRAAFAELGKCLFLTCADIEERFPNLKLDDPTVASWLNSIESE